MCLTAARVKLQQETGGHRRPHLISDKRRMPQYGLERSKTRSHDKLKVIPESNSETLKDFASHDTIQSI